MWQRERGDKEEERIADYTVEETSKGPIIRTEDGKMSFWVPSGWSLKEIGGQERFFGVVQIFSPELSKNIEEGIEENKFNSKEGCLFEIGMTENYFLDLEELEEKSKEDHQFIGLESEENYEMIDFYGHDALENTLVSSTFGCCKIIHIIVGNKLRNITVCSGKKDKEKCFQEFDEFLETALIAK